MFDLLTGLLDSWSLWNEIAGSAEQGRLWRAAYLRITYRTGAYRPYTDLVAEAAEDVGLPTGLARELDARFGELRPWPEVGAVLLALADAGVRLGVVTNCSERLGRIAAGCVGVELDVVVTSERAGFYKPHARPYQLGLAELGVDPGRCLFVAGSAFDLAGTAAVGLPTYWHDRIGMAALEGVAVPLAREASLKGLLPLVVGRG